MITCTAEVDPDDGLLWESNPGMSSRTPGTRPNLLSPLTWTGAELHPFASAMINNLPAGVWADWYDETDLVQVDVKVQWTDHVVITCEANRRVWVPRALAADAERIADYLGDESDESGQWWRDGKGANEDCETTERNFDGVSFHLLPGGFDA
ncbi:hypothetical protein ACFVGM_09155 [Kitasatospora purpeofusca]|uniref:hypothetical protein n=1 Tax=Kitasatospora purpeofusca TaxID=67352 RepID=UPI0036C5B707